MSDGPCFLIRPAEAADIEGVVPLWLESAWRSTYARAFRCDDPACRRCDRNVHSTRFEDISRCAAKQDYWLIHAKRVRQLVARSQVRIACDEMEHASILGFCVVEANTLHFLMAKRWCHGAGLTVELFGRLLGEDYSRPLAYTHEIVDLRRDDVKASGWKIPGNWRHDPFAVIERAA